MFQYELHLISVAKLDLWCLYSHKVLLDIFLHFLSHDKEYQIIRRAAYLYSLKGRAIGSNTWTFRRMSHPAFLLGGVRFSQYSTPFLLRWFPSGIEVQLASANRLTLCGQNVLPVGSGLTVLKFLLTWKVCHWQSGLKYAIMLLKLHFE